MPPAPGPARRSERSLARQHLEGRKQKEEEPKSLPVTLSPSQQTKVLLAKPSQMLHSSLVTFR